MKRKPLCGSDTATEWAGLRIPFGAVALFAVWLHVPCGMAQDLARRDPVLGPAPTAPRDVPGLPPNEPRQLDAGTAGFSVNGSSREEVRQFYTAVYAASESIPLDSTADATNCVAGTNSAAFQTAELWRINWFRAMSGMPAAVTFSASESVADQSAALMMSANNLLLHDEIPTSWSCYTAAGANAAQDSNLALGINGPDAITGYIQDPGAVNTAVAHRRWLLYPQTQVMAGGDVPAQGADVAADAIWVIDSNYGGPRPETAAPYVAWPPPGYVPYSVVFPQWSFALSNADLSLASVTMSSNGVPVNVTLQPYQPDYGENTLVWYPSALDPTSYNTVFPFNGADTVYAITIANANTAAGPQSFSYNVTVFDPAFPGANYVPTLVIGTNHPSVNENNPYACNASANPGATGYQWMAARSTNGDMAYNAFHGLTNLTISPAPTYSVTTNPPIGPGQCFHLTHTNPVPQLLQFTEVLYPATNTLLIFASYLGYATTTEVARVQVSTNGGAWTDIFTQTGTGGPSQTPFVPHFLSLSNCAGQITAVRFDYDLGGGSYFPTTDPNVGWSLEDISITNSSQLLDFSTNATVSNNFDFVPAQPGNWALAARPVIFNQFGLDWGPPTAVTAVTNAAPTLILLGAPALAAGQAQIPFVLTQGASPSFHLLQASQVTGPWTTNAGAVLSNLAGGSSFQFTTPFAGATVFYRVLAP